MISVAVFKIFGASAKEKFRIRACAITENMLPPQNLCRAGLVKRFGNRNKGARVGLAGCRHVSVFQLEQGIEAGNFEHAFYLSLRAFENDRCTRLLSFVTGEQQHAEPG